MKINNYKISLYNCKNKHQIKDLSLKEYQGTQKIDNNKIRCNICKNINRSQTFNNIFFKCITCNKSLCPMCKQNHDANHFIINYDLINYRCFKHNEAFTSYCKDCLKNLCMLCENEHENHDTVYFGKLITNSDKIKLNIKNLRNSIDKFKENINDIIKKLNNVQEYMEKYYQLFVDINSNIESKQRNYEVLANIKQINIDNNDLIKEIDEIINENDINNKIKKIIEISNKTNNDNFDEITLIYNIDKNENKVKLFGSDFVNNNKDNCNIIYEGKNLELMEYFNLKNFSDISNSLIIKLKGINQINNADNMFYECSSLKSIPDLDKWDVTKLVKKDNMFYGCDPSLIIPYDFIK